MATIPQHSGYNVQSGVGTGPNGDRIDVWIEWKLLSQNLEQNYSEIDAYFYAALKPGETSETHGSSGAYGEVEIDDGTGYSLNMWAYNVPYDFRSSSNVNNFGDDGEHYTITIFHDDDGVSRNKMKAAFTTPSSWITGGYVAEFIPSLPDIPRGFRVKVSGVWRNSQAYVRVSGVWRACLVYSRVSGVWKIGS